MMVDNNLARYLGLGTSRYTDYVALGTTGAGGEVFRARDLHAPPGRSDVVVIKRPIWNQLENGDFQGRLIENELRALMALRDVPGVCRLRDSGQARYLVHQGRSSVPYTYIVMEYAQGEDLRSLIEKTKKKGTSFPLAVALRILVAFAETLAEVHRKGIAYNDFKVEHLFWDSMGRLTVIDWGMADFLSTFHENDADGQTPFTEEDKARINEEIRRFGDVMFFVLAGDSADTRRQQQGFGGSSNGTTLRDIGDPGLRDIMHKIYSSEPDTRFESMVELTAALRLQLDTLEQGQMPLRGTADEWVRHAFRPADGAKRLSIEDEGMNRDSWRLDDQQVQDDLVLWQLYVGEQDWGSASRICKQLLAQAPNWETASALAGVTNALSFLTDLTTDEAIAEITQVVAEAQYQEALTHTIRFEGDEADPALWKGLCELCGALLQLLNPPRPRLKERVKCAVGLVATLETALGDDLHNSDDTGKAGSLRDFRKTTNALRAIAAELWSEPAFLPRHTPSYKTEAEYRRLQQHAQELASLCVEYTDHLPKAMQPILADVLASASDIEDLTGTVVQHLESVTEPGKAIGRERLTSLWEACVYDVDSFALRRLARQAASGIASPSHVASHLPGEPADLSGGQTTWLIEDGVSNQRRNSRAAPLSRPRVRERLQQVGRAVQHLLQMRAPSGGLAAHNLYGNGTNGAEEQHEPVKPEMADESVETLAQTGAAESKGVRRQHRKPLSGLNSNSRQEVVGTGRGNRSVGNGEKVSKTASNERESTPETETKPRSVRHEALPPPPSAYHRRSLVIIDGTGAQPKSASYDVTEHGSDARFFFAQDGCLYIKIASPSADRESLIITLDDILAARKPAVQIGHLATMTVIWEAVALPEGALAGLLFSTTPAESYIVALCAVSDTQGAVVVLKPRDKVPENVLPDANRVALAGLQTFHLEYSHAAERGDNHVTVHADASKQSAVTLHSEPHPPQMGLLVRGVGTHIRIHRLEITFEARR